MHIPARLHDGQLLSSNKEESSCLPFWRKKWRCLPETHSNFRVYCAPSQ